MPPLLTFIFLISLFLSLSTFLFSSLSSLSHPLYSFLPSLSLALPFLYSDFSLLLFTSFFFIFSLFSFLDFPFYFYFYIYFSYFTSVISFYFSFSFFTLLTIIQITKFDIICNTLFTIYIILCNFMTNKKLTILKMNISCMMSRRNILRKDCSINNKLRFRYF